MPLIKSKRVLGHFRASSSGSPIEIRRRGGDRATPCGRFRFALSAAALTAPLHRPQGAPPQERIGTEGKLPSQHWNPSQAKVQPDGMGTFSPEF